MRPAVRRTIPWIGVALAVACGASAALSASRSAALRAAARDPHPFLELHAPRVEGSVPIDAEMEGKKIWESETGSTGVFKDANGLGMVPYTEAKVRWGEGKLYLWLYAGDLDLEGSVTERDGPVSRDDSFHVEIGSDPDVYVIDVSVLGTVADSKCDRSPLGSSSAAPPTCDRGWDSGVVVAVDKDGTLNKLGDNDEEWIVEMAVPLPSVGVTTPRAGTRVPFAVRRCEMGKDGPHACGGFGDRKTRGEIVFESAAAEGGPRLARSNAQ
jgi:hypothetical protein